MRPTKRISRETILTCPLDGPPNEKVIGPKMYEFIERTVVGVLYQATWMEAKTGGRDNLSIEAGQEPAVVFAHVVNLFNGGQRLVMQDLLAIRLPPRRVNFPVRIQIFVRGSLAHFHPVLNSRSDVPFPVLVELLK